MKRPKLMALGYHSIWHLQNRYTLHGELYEKLSLSSVLFEEHVRFLKNTGYTFLQFRDILAMQDGTMTMPAKPILLYFDDGYRDTLLNAYPLLKKFGARATLFVTTNFIDQKTLPRWAGNLNPRDAGIFLTWEELRGMRDVFEIGSHAVTHRRFTTLNGGEITEELVVSRAVIDKEIGVSPDAFSYPHSAWSEESKHAVLEAGYRIAMGVGRGYNYGSDLTFLKKVPIGHHDDVRQSSHQDGSPRCQPTTFARRPSRC